MDDGEGGALPDLHAELQDWRDPDMVGLAKVAPAGRQCAQRALPQPFPLLLHACANERPPGARLSTASDMLSRRWVPGESAGGRNRAPALSPLPADARSLPHLQPAGGVEDVPNARLHQGVEIGADEYARHWHIICFAPKILVRLSEGQ